MPKENRSSNTENLPCPFCAGRVDPEGWLRGDGTRGPECESCGATAPTLSVWNSVNPTTQPHPDPIAWMVGTAFWWTKEEADRDAADTGMPIVGLGPMVDQHQGVPVALPERLPLDSEFSTYGLGKIQGWNDYHAAAAKLGPLYTHADPAEVERLRRACEAEFRSVEVLNEANQKLQAQLTEAQAMLKRCEESLFNLLCFGVPEDRTEADKMIDELAALSASAERRAPIAWHVGGNGYDRICFEMPAELPGHPCIQPIHDQRQLIDLLKRYDLRDEDVPPDERVHGISGTSFQRLNALANQGE